MVEVILFRGCSAWRNQETKAKSSLLDYHTDKKEKKIFLIYKEIQSYMTYGLLIYGEIFAHFLILGSPSSNMTLQLLHSEFKYT
jgi:hypothetical protein